MPGDCTIDGWPGNTPQKGPEGIYTSSWTSAAFEEPQTKYYCIGVCDAGACGDGSSDPACPVVFPYVYVIGGALIGTNDLVLYYRCTDGGESAVIMARGNQPEGTAYTWSVEGPLAIDGPSDGPSVVVKTADPPVGVCQGKVKCKYSLEGVECEYEAAVQVRKPYKLQEGGGGLTTVHETYDGDLAGSSQIGCITDFFEPDVEIWGWMYDICYAVLDQCDKLMSDITMWAFEDWTGEWQPEVQGNPEVYQGVFCDCVGVVKFGGPVTNLNPPKSGVQTWRVWGCVVRTNNWTAGNSDGSYTSSGP